MPAYPLWPRTRGVLTAAALAFTLAGAPGAGAGEPTPAWLSAIGDFIRDGVEPPRTVDDLMRAEEARRVAKPAPAPQPAPVPVAITAPPPAKPDQPNLFAPAPVEIPELPKAVEAPPPVAVVAPRPAATMAPRPAAVAPRPAATVAPRPAAVAPRPAVTPAELKPRPVERTASRTMPVPQPAAEPLTGSRIAATATLDQAMRLGGPAGLYAQRIKRPQIAP